MASKRRKLPVIMKSPTPALAYDDDVRTNNRFGSRKLAIAGSKTSAPSIFQRNIKASNSPISA